MRTVQISIHCELFGENLPRGWREEHPGERYGFHVYADDHDFGGALLSAISEATKVYSTQVRTLGVRVDSISSASDDEFERSMVRRLESSRPVDLTDSKLLVEGLRKERGEKGEPIESIEELYEAALDEIQRRRDECGEER